MSGIRLHSDTLANMTIAVECARTYVQPFECPLCGVTHIYKTVHLTFDNDGDVIVSQGVWETDLKDHPSLEIVVENEVTNPPPIILGGPPTKPEAMELIVAQTFNGRR